MTSNAQGMAQPSRQPRLSRTPAGVERRVASLFVVRAGLQLLLGADVLLVDAVERLLRTADFLKHYPAGPVSFELRNASGEHFRLVEFAGAGEPTSLVIRRWYDRMSRSTGELPPHVHDFVDFLLSRAMEQWDTETC